MDEQMRDHFNRSVGGYDAYTKKSYSLQRERKAWQRMYREILGSSDQTVLNVGCGPGTEAMALADAGFTVTAVDFSPKMVEAAKRNAKDNNLSILVLEGDAEDLRFEDDSFDCVVSNYAMWAIPNPDKALSEFLRVLKPGGILAYADTGSRKTDHKHLRKIWVKIAVRMRDRDGNSHKGESTQEDRDRIRKLWSSGADRPAKDLQMAKDAGFRDVTIHSDLNRRVFKGTRYIEYGYTKGFLLVARK